MSFDVFLQGFEDGDAREVDPAVLVELLRPRLDSDRTSLVFEDGSAEVDGLDDGSLMVSHASGTQVWAFLMDVAKTADLVFMPIGCSVCAVSARQLEHLPGDLRDDAVIVSSGDELVAVITAGD